MESMYGEDYLEYGSPYRKRLLRLDMETLTWTRLEINRPDIPALALCFGVELKPTDGGDARILVGGGYGLTRGAYVHSASLSIGSPEQELIQPEVASDVMIVHVRPASGTPFADRVSRRKGWKRDFYGGPWSDPQNRPFHEIDLLSSGRGLWLVGHPTRNKI